MADRLARRIVRPAHLPVVGQVLPWLKGRFWPGAAREAALRSEVKQLRARVAELERDTSALYVPPGHYYSPIPDPDAVAQLDAVFLNRVPHDLLGLDLNEAGQLALVQELAASYPEMPFEDGRTPGLRFWFDNDQFGHGDAVMLYGMLRHLRPKRVIEIGSGYSSCVTLDTNARFFANQISCTFIEPYPERLLSLIQPGDRERFTLIPTPLQDVDVSVFEQLEAGDILFIDSTHVAKLQSDVNYYMFEILPRIAPGVYIHIHDIFYPFEYPLLWIQQQRAWTELYLLRAFLQYNQQFSIALFNGYLWTYHRELMGQLMPTFLKNPGGSIWLRRE
jgi:hypothetical protein